jgi:uncharacterized protein YndB with AHSA1/START domain
MSTQNQHASNAEQIISHEFDAPRELVFEAFSTADALAEWWGPKGFPITVVKLDFKPGGIFHYKAEINGQTMWGRFVYGQIEKPHLIEFIVSFSDEKGGIARAPFSNTWPLQIMNILSLTEQNGKTKMTLTGYPLNATEAEIDTFVAHKKQAEEGFAGTFDQLKEYLSSRQTAIK